MATKTIQIINAGNGGFVYPAETHVAQGGTVVFTIDQGWATVALPNTGDFACVATPASAGPGGQLPSAAGMGILLRVGQNAPAKLTRSKSRRASVKAIPFIVCIDGAETFAMPASASYWTMSSMNPVSCPVIILDPP